MTVRDVRATYHLSPTVTAAMVIRGMHSRIFIGLMREVLWARSLDEGKQDQKYQLSPVPYHALFLSWCLVRSTIRCILLVYNSRSVREERVGMFHTARLTMVYLSVPVLLLRTVINTGAKGLEPKDIPWLVEQYETCLPSSSRTDLLLRRGGCSGIVERTRHQERKSA